MTPNSITLKGFRGIRDGLGRDELTINLDSIAGNAKLVAISGANGAGKTTLMDNLHPYLVMPSRAGADGMGRFSYYDHVVLTENLKELVWTHAGVRYRSEVIIRVNGKKKTEAFLYVDRGGNWSPYRLSDGTASDGKVETYTRAVEEICGSRETFFTSQFSAQGKRQLSAYDPAEIKSLLADLLGHEIIRKTGQQGAKVIDLVKIGLTGQRQALATIESERNGVAQALESLGDPGATLLALTEEREKAQAELQVAIDDRARIQAESQSAAQTEVRRQQLGTERSALISEGKEAVTRIDIQVGREATQKKELTDQIAKRLAAHQAAITQASTRVANLRKTIAGGAGVEWAKKRLPLADAVVAGRETQVAELRETVAKLGELTQQKRGKEENVANIEREAGKASLRAEELARRFGLAEEVPCAGTAMQGECKLLGDAMAAKPLLPSAKADIARLAGERAAVLAGIKEIESSISSILQSMGVANYEAAKSLIQEGVARVEAARRRASRMAVLAARETDIAQAKLDLVDVEADLSKLLSESDDKTEEEKAKLASYDAMVSELITQRGELAAQFRQRLDALDVAIAALPAPFDQAGILKADAMVTAKKTLIERIEQQHNAALQAKQAVAGYQARMSELDEKINQQRSAVADVETKLSYWMMFAKCMSNDGVIALAIDDAGPTLAAYTNDLLLACYGQRFSVSIVTQSTTAKGETREDFDIIVHDGQSGDSKSVTQMSGGERVWINECLVRAIALYLAQNKGRSCDTLFSDETDGPLDPERKRMFMAMKNEVLRLGGYQREYFVTQTPELSAMADAVIDVEAYRV